MEFISHEEDILINILRNNLTKYSKNNIWSLEVKYFNGKQENQAK